MSRITKTIALLIINTRKAKYGLSEQFSQTLAQSKRVDATIEKASCSYHLFESLLSIKDVRTYIDLSKSQIIEKMDCLYNEIEMFDMNNIMKKSNKLLLVSIVSIGFGLNAETDPRSHIDTLKTIGW